MKLTLYVPDALFERLEKYRDRINASAVLQRCLERELASLEAADQFDGEDLDRAIERLRSEKTVIEGEFRERGQAEGMSWALKASYGDLSWCANAYLRNSKKLTGSAGSIYKMIREARSSRFEAVDHPTREDPPVVREAFWMGFLEGVMRVWRKLEEASGPSAGSVEGSSEPEGRL
jgi:hypothetical protein